LKFKLLKNKIPQDTIEYLQDYTLEVKKRIKPYEGTPKSNGSGVYWKGLDMASNCPICSHLENKKLFNVYTSDFMYDIITDYIPNPFLFNDQIVVKEPYEHFDFEPHRDNQYGPYPNDETLLTINCMLVLDDFTNENGAIKVYDNEWLTLYPQKGDILLIEGNTLHSSENNNTNFPRRAYLCVYSNKSIGKDFQKGFYYERFEKNS
tara:strand:- start:693 stop:1310 length:618 start_codon:yes stop_codon:yes gene_type:complete